MARRPIPDDAWREVAAGIACLDRLGPADERRLFDFATLFVHEKEIEPCGAEVDDLLRYTIALQASVLVLGIGYDALAGVRRVLVYPGGFRARRTFVDEIGVVHDGDEDLLGEAWDEGHVLLNREDVLDGSAVRDGWNLVLHECSHLLDLATGEPDGVPPLPAGVDAAHWRATFAAAAEDLDRRDERGEHTPIDPYAAEDPAETFAVFTESFFEIPDVVRAAYPACYELLVAFYRQDPAGG